MPDEEVPPDDQEIEPTPEEVAEAAPEEPPPPDTPAKLSPDQINKLLKADLSNLVRKVSSGRTLTPTERQMLQGMGNAGGGTSASSKAAEEANPFVVPTVAPKWAKNQSELADILGVNRRTIHKYRKGGPRARPNGEWPVEAWRKYLIGQQVIEPENADVDLLRAEGQALQNAKLAVQVGVLKGDYVSVDDVKKWTSDMVSQAKKVLLGLPAAFAPQVIGLTAVEAEQVLRSAVGEALIQLSENPDGLRRPGSGAARNGKPAANGIPHGRHAPKARAARMKQAAEEA